MKPVDRQALITYLRNSVEGAEVGRTFDAQGDPEAQEYYAGKRDFAQGLLNTLERENRGEGLDRFTWTG
jgi:hypothetical protein